MLVFAGRMLPKKLAVDRRDPLPILYADQQNSCSGHVRKPAAQAFNGGLDNFETPSRLTCCIAFRDRLAIFAEWGCPLTAMIRPDRTAREMPTFGSKRDPVETCCRWLLKALLPQTKCDLHKRPVSHCADIQGTSVCRTRRKSTLVKTGLARDSRRPMISQILYRACAIAIQGDDKVVNTQLSH